MLSRLLLAGLLTTLAGSAIADSIGNTASEKISVGAVSVLAAPVVSIAGSATGRGESALGPVLAVTGSGYVIVGLVEGSGDVIKLTLESVQGGAKLLVELSRSTVKASGAAIGSAVQVTATASGTLLVVSGKVLAFIPNKLGEALLEHSRVPS
ncbi:hypothetical protein [Aquitalea aquatica]|uniref:Uncharacterized protein n=1 Tax=Aquitalea aquatica TaxID=3044273 RepID=A0A838XZR4_9NEIS|nr:hypothetical protein [Aquitalea magnusonii]MBA4708273.1 hypothetical protein [Aquitalea magnusonii]